MIKVNVVAAITFKNFKLVAMKYSFYLLFITLTYCQLIGCKKEAIDPGSRIISTPDNISPNAYAGEDLFVWPPFHEATLSGSYFYPRDKIKKVSWVKIDGPDSYKLEKRDSLSTKVSGLVAGLYKFELTVTDERNFSDWDIVTLFVGESTTGPNKIIFKDVEWISISPWYPGIEIKNFANNVAPGSAFKIFIQRDFDSTWSEVLATNQVSLTVKDCMITLLVQA